MSWSRTLKIRQILRAQIEAGEEIALLFSDLRGFSTFTASEGDRAAFRLTQLHEGILRVRISEYGIVVKSLGDGMMAAFERPIDAIRAGVAIQRAVREWNREHRDDSIDIGIGIASGTPVMTDIDFIGHSVNVAQRLSGLAKGGEILATGQICRNAGPASGLHYLPLGQRSLRGIGLEQIVEVGWLEEVGRISDVRDRITLILTAEGSVVIEVAKDPKPAVRDAVEELHRATVSEDGLVSTLAQRAAARLLRRLFRRASKASGIGREYPLERITFRYRRGTLGVRTPDGEIDLTGVPRSEAEPFLRRAAERRTKDAKVAEEG